MQLNGLGKFSKSLLTPWIFKFLKPESLPRRKVNAGVGSQHESLLAVVQIRLLWQPTIFSCSRARTPAGRRRLETS